MSVGQLTYTVGYKIAWGSTSPGHRGPRPCSYLADDYFDVNSPHDDSCFSPDFLHHLPNGFPPPPSTIPAFTLFCIDKLCSLVLFPIKERVPEIVRHDSMR